MNNELPPPDPELGDETPSEELKPLLLEAIRGPHQPMPPDYFDELRRSLRK